MSTPRFPPLAPASLDAEQRAVAEALENGPRGGVRGPFNALLRKPALAERVRALGDSIRFENSLPPPLRELAILIVARFWDARYEWHAHSRLAAELGVSAETIDAVGAGAAPPHPSDDESIVHRFCTELLERKDVSDETYAAAVARFGEATLLDLIATAGYFGFVSLILNAIRHPVPDGGTPLPERRAS
jgi:4-carboxymuconolactone decarboxylase